MAFATRANERAAVLAAMEQDHKDLNSMASAAVRALYREFASRQTYMVAVRMNTQDGPVQWLYGPYSSELDAKKAAAKVAVGQVAVFMMNPPNLLEDCLPGGDPALGFCTTCGHRKSEHSRSKTSIVNCALADCECKRFTK